MTKKRVGLLGSAYTGNRENFTKSIPKGFVPSGDYNLIVEVKRSGEVIGADSIPITIVEEDHFHVNLEIVKPVKVTGGTHVVAQKNKFNLTCEITKEDEKKLKSFGGLKKSLYWVYTKGKLTRDKIYASKSEDWIHIDEGKKLVKDFSIDQIGDYTVVVEIADSKNNILGFDYFYVNVISDKLIKLSNPENKNKGHLPALPVLGMTSCEALLDGSLNVKNVKWFIAKGIVSEKVFDKKKILSSWKQIGQGTLVEEFIPYNSDITDPGVYTLISLYGRKSNRFDYVDWSYVELVETMAHEDYELYARKENESFQKVDPKNIYVVDVDNQYHFMATLKEMGVLSANDFDKDLYLKILSDLAKDFTLVLSKGGKEISNVNKRNILTHKFIQDGDYLLTFFKKGKKIASMHIYAKKGNSPPLPSVGENRIAYTEVGNLPEEYDLNKKSPVYFELNKGYEFEYISGSHMHDQILWTLKGEGIEEKYLGLKFKKNYTNPGNYLLTVMARSRKGVTLIARDIPIVVIKENVIVFNKKGEKQIRYDLKKNFLIKINVGETYDFTYLDGLYVNSVISWSLEFENNAPEGDLGQHFRHTFNEPGTGIIKVEANSLSVNPTLISEIPVRVIGQPLKPVVIAHGMSGVRPYDKYVDGEILLLKLNDLHEFEYIDGPYDTSTLRWSLLFNNEVLSTADGSDFKFGFGESGEFELILESRPLGGTGYKTVMTIPINVAEENIFKKIEVIYKEMNDDKFKNYDVERRPKLTFHVEDIYEFRYVEGPYDTDELFCGLYGGLYENNKLIEGFNGAKGGLFFENKGNFEIRFYELGGMPFLVIPIRVKGKKLISPSRPDPDLFDLIKGLTKSIHDTNISLNTFAYRLLNGSIKLTTFLNLYKILDKFDERLLANESEKIRLFRTPYKRLFKECTIAYNNFSKFYNNAIRSGRLHLVVKEKMLIPFEGKSAIEFEKLIEDLRNSSDEYDKSKYGRYVWYFKQYQNQLNSFRSKLVELRKLLLKVYAQEYEEYRTKKRQK